MHNFPRRTGFLITGILTVISAILLLLCLGLEVGLPLVFIYGVIFFLLADFIVIIREAEAARRGPEKAREESQKQQAELQSAYRQLQSYTAQAEELAVLQERNRMARNLHDSVTQTIFSMRMTAEASRMHLECEPARVGAKLDKLQTLAKSAFAEIRSLIFERRPTAMNELRLIPARQIHVLVTAYLRTMALA